MEEVKKKIVFAMNDNGASASNGFGDFFLQTYWDIFTKDMFSTPPQL